jgi:hypothetical protein
LLLGYRTKWLNVMPYVMAEHSSYTNTDLAPPAWAYSAGVNIRPTPNVVLKAEMAYAHFIGVGSTGLGKDDLPYFGSQVAWAFWACGVRFSFCSPSGFSSRRRSPC